KIGRFIRDQIVGIEIAVWFGELFAELGELFRGERAFSAFGGGLGNREGAIRFGRWLLLRFSCRFGLLFLLLLFLDAGRLDQRAKDQNGQKQFSSHRALLRECGADFSLLYDFS